MQYVKIKSIEIDGQEDVFNMEVESHHNFSVNGGFIVHNCYDSVGYGLISHHVAKSKAKTAAEKTNPQKHKERVLSRGARSRRR